jgi:hypothetical protein
LNKPCPTLSDAYGKAIEQLNTGHGQCPPVFNLDSLRDGKYSVYMISCGIGGKIEFTLETR